MERNLLVSSIIENIKQIELNSYDEVYVPSRDYINKAISQTIEENCFKYNLNLIKEYEFIVTEEERERYSRKTITAFTDFVINHNVALEIDGGVKKWSYDKLDILNKKGMKCFWFIFKRNSFPNISEFNFYNKNISVITHNFKIK